MTKLTPALRGLAAAALRHRLQQAFAQAYPARPVTVVVPWGRRGPTRRGIVAALLEKDLASRQRGQPHRRLRLGRPFAIATAQPEG